MDTSIPANAETHHEKDVVVSNQSVEDASGGVPATAMLFASTIGLLFITFSIAITYYFFFSYRDTLLKERLESSYVEELHAQRAKEKQELSEYGVIDPQQEIIRLPIASGIEKVLEVYK